MKEDVKKNVFEKLWEQYEELTPQAAKIDGLLKSKGETILNDHIAFRSVDLPGFGLKNICKPFEHLDYEIKGDYDFQEKKLTAVHLESPHPKDPKIFVSELRLDDLSSQAKDIIEKALYYVEPPGDEALLWVGRLWEATYENYQKLYEESEYAAWFYAFGYCANHFTVSVNDLKIYDDLSKLNALLEEQGFELNESGGKIKGSKEVCLEQSSTKASKRKVDFEDGAQEIPSCYYEFAKRYPQENGQLYQGFVTQSADKIFESTN